MKSKLIQLLILLIVCIVLVLPVSAEGDTGSLSVQSIPPDAKIFIDGSDTGIVTPWTFVMNVGTYNVYVTLDGYVTPASQTKVVNKNQVTKYMFCFEGVDAPPEVAGMMPSDGFTDSEEHTYTVEGSGFQSGSTVSLEKEGTDPIFGTKVELESESVLFVNFSFTTEQIGLYDVVIRNPKCGGVGRLNEGFRVRPEPVVLVHGWRGTPDVWEATPEDPTGSLHHELLDHGGYSDDDIWIFDYTTSNTNDPRPIAVLFDAFIEERRQHYGYTGKIDIVCHSFGALVTRYYIEKLDRSAKVGQWIGIAPVNHGAAVANLREIKPFTWFANFVRVIQFWKDGVNPDEPAVVQMETNSPTVIELDNAGHRPDVTYRVLVGYNSDQLTTYRGFLGRTLVYDTSINPPKTYWTFYGDGVVALRQSYLSWGGLDCFGGETHNTITHDNDVISLVRFYLQNPDTKIEVIEPTSNEGQEPFDPDMFQTGTVNSGEYQDVQLIVAPNVVDLTIISDIPGSEIDLTLTTPSGHQIHGLDPLVYEYTKDATSIIYKLKRPEAGTWVARIDAIDVPPEGEPFILAKYEETGDDDCGSGVVRLEGFSNPPTDPDSDGLYEDLNANGFADWDDAVVLFWNTDWIQDNEPVSAFDFNGNGFIDWDDAVVLFWEV